MSRVAAHLIIGAREEPFLEALLRSLQGVADSLIVNDNAPDPSPHTTTLQESSFARRGSLLVDRSPFVDFATARNHCLRLHREEDGSPWIAFVDADDIHDETASRVREHLEAVPPQIGRVDAYSRQFFASFDWYTSIERRMIFYRFNPSLRWENPVHEKLIGLPPAGIALPYVLGHYGHTLPVERRMHKERQYASLGAPSQMTPSDDADAAEIVAYYADFYPRLIRFRGRHAPAVRSTIERLRGELSSLYSLTDRMAGSQPLAIRVRNILRAGNYEQRWRLRILNPLARRLVAP